MDNSNREEVVSVSFPITLFTIFWFVVAVGAFVWFLFATFHTPELRATTAGSLAWPFVTLVIALPVSMLFGANIRHLLGLKKTIDDAPKKLADAFETAEKLRLNLEESGGKITNDINGALGEIEARMTAFEGRLQRLVAQPPGPVMQSLQTSPRERLGVHLEKASDRFYETLETWNSDGRRKGRQLVVTRGGGNRSDLVERLRLGGAFDRDEERNNAIAAYLKATFETQLSARRGGLEAANIEKLDKLNEAAISRGAALE